MIIKRKMKMSLSILVIAVMLFVTGCGKDETNDGNLNKSKVENENKVQVVTSFYPLYFMAAQIGGDAIEVTNLISSGVEPHNWSPKSKDLVIASEADLLLYHGAGFETWIESFQKGLDKNSNVVIKEVSAGINLIDPTRENEENDSHTHDDHEHAEGDHDHAHDDHADDNHDHATDDHDHAHTVDPHTWVSPKSALAIAENIKQALIDISPNQEQVFTANFNSLAEKIKTLDEKYETELGKIANKHIVVSHQSFGYVARDYGLEQISIMGLNPNSEPRAQDIKNIANLVKEHEVKYVFFEELVNDNLAKMLASEAKVDTMVLYSLEGLTTKQEKQGDNYLSLMELNLQNLISALQ